MDLEQYPFVFSNDHRRYTFYSEGPKGRIEKTVSFYRFPTLYQKIFNLGFGDWDSNKQRIDDLAISNNSDLEKILATIAATAIDFLQQNPDALIFAEGATASRTRLYQIKISVHWSEICKVLDIYSRIDDQWMPFQKGTNYEAFLAQLK